MLLASCDNLKKPVTKDQPQEATVDTAVVYRNGKTIGPAAGAANAAENAWDVTKAKLADVKFKEITLSGVRMRGESTDDIYSVDEKVLFDTYKYDIKPGAAESLMQITGSIGQCYGASRVRVMGFADLRGDKGYNKGLSAERAEAVKTSW